MVGGDVWLLLLFIAELALRCSTTISASSCTRLRRTSPTTSSRLDSISLRRKLLLLISSRSSLPGSNSKPRATQEHETKKNKVLPFN